MFFFVCVLVQGHAVGALGADSIKPIARLDRHRNHGRKNERKTHAPNNPFTCLFASDLKQHTFFACVLFRVLQVAHAVFLFCLCCFYFQRTHTHMGYRRTSSGRSHCARTLMHEHERTHARNGFAHQYGEHSVNTYTGDAGAAAATAIQSIRMVRAS